MKSAAAERVMDGNRYGNTLKGRNENHLLDQVVKVNSPEDSMALIVLDSCMILLFYPAPVAAFVFKVNLVVANLMSMPVN